ncbi:MAG: hypothetical protein UV80_C0006G0092 [Candidatus Peregrinibacteria bacterium GW2011_GWF2_43_17]|nr:MAG: hypothetical protein UV80_C0006G0092 [Candidatus Peregrinibacteria bacterium GW2011_GWF2_43_17]KKT19012.1 MAG: hypothetical protein UW03_C0025G0004 [Candidatus Peregrinibacteria bacterium GW2011_GWA2_43_8]HAU40096.1 hypothetical protein [Candidatus Peregrinibacteria bacterium]
MYKIVITEHFKKQLKKLVKKDRFLKERVINTLNCFDKNQSIAIGRAIFKIRIQGLGKGKSGGYRLYIFLLEAEGILAPICIYSKNDIESISFDELADHFRLIKAELASLL